jgi:hypothetical protein
VRETQCAREAAREEVEDLVRREIAHHFVQNVNQVPARFTFIAHALKLSLRVPERRPQ